MATSTAYDSTSWTWVNMKPPYMGVTILPHLGTILPHLGIRLKRSWFVTGLWSMPSSMWCPTSILMVLSEVTSERMRLVQTWTENGLSLVWNTVQRCASPTPIYCIFARSNSNRLTVRDSSCVCNLERKDVWIRASISEASVHPKAQILVSMKSSEHS